MFGNKNRSDRELEAWIQSLESEDWDSPDLRAAQVLKSAQPNAVLLSESTRSALRQRLIDQHERRRTPFFVALRYLFLATSAVLAIMLMVVTVNFVNNGGATQWVERIAPIVRVLQAEQPSEILYERAIIKQEGLSPITTLGGYPLYDEAVIETWYTPDFASYRYQVANLSGEIVYFEQWHNRTWTYSVYDFSKMQQSQSFPPPPLKPQLAETPIDDASKQQMAWSDVSWLTSALIEMDWARLNLMLKQNRAHCSEPFCLLGASKENKQWQCKNDVCKRQFDSLRGVKVSLNRDYNDDKVYAMDIEPLPSGIVWFRLLFNRQTLQLIQLSEHGYGGIKGLVLHNENTELPSPDPKIFEQVPIQLEKTANVNAWYLPPSIQIRFQVKSVSPPPGTRIDQPTQLQVGIDYELSHYFKEVPIVVGLAARDQMPGQPLMPQNSNTPVITQGSGVITATINIVPTQTRSTLWDLQVLPWARPDSYEAQARDDLFWCIGCDPKSFAKIKLTGVFPTSGKLIIQGTSSSPDGTCLYSQLVLQQQVGGQRVSWWPMDQCIIVKKKYWKIELDLQKVASNEKFLSEDMYWLRIWEKGHPEFQPTFFIGPLKAPDSYRFQ